MTKYAVVTQSGEMTGRIVEIPDDLSEDTYAFFIEGMGLGEMELNPLPDDYPIYMSPLPNTLEMVLNSSPPGQNPLETPE